MQGISSTSRGRVDRMSGLPDELLIHILSFLTTRQAIQMSLLLSKRWSHLWTSIPSLHFSESEFLVYVGGDNVSTRFLRFIDQVLNCQRENNNITKFHFSAYKYINDGNIARKWIIHALRGRKVEEFTIEAVTWGENFGRIKLPRRLFACRSLRVLKLDMGMSVNLGMSKLQLPTTFCDLSLKSLHLESLVFDELPRLISYCPFLEDLYLRRVHCDDLKISAQRLEKLTIYECHVATFEVSAPSLLSFNFIGREVDHFVLKNLVSLVETDIEISYRFSKNNHVLSGILVGVSNVSSLALTYSGIRHQDLPDDLPMFENLTYLMLKIWLNKHSIEVMIYILEHSPNLETLVIYNDKFKRMHDWHRQEEQENQHSDQFLLLLEKIKYENYPLSGMQLETQQELVNYLFGSNPSLVEITITNGDHNNVYNRVT